MMEPEEVDKYITISKLQSLLADRDREIAELNEQIKLQSTCIDVADVTNKTMYKEIEELKGLLSHLGRHDPQCERRARNDKKNGLNPVCDCGLEQALK